MSEANKAVAQKFITALGKGDAAVLGELMSPDIEAIATGTCLLSGTRKYADVTAAAGMLGQITQNGIAVKFISVTAEDDRVAVEWDGSSMLVTGQPYNNQYLMLFQIRDGKIVRLKEYFDSLLVENALGPIVRGAAA